MNTDRVLPGAIDSPLAQVELADVVRLYKPHEPARGIDRQRGPFGFIVAEIFQVLPGGRVRGANL